MGLALARHDSTRPIAGGNSTKSGCHVHRHPFCFREIRSQADYLNSQSVMDTGPVLCPLVHLVQLVTKGLIPLLLPKETMLPTATSGRCLRELLVFPEVDRYPEFYNAGQSLFLFISSSAEAAKIAQRQWLIKNRSFFLTVLENEGSKSRWLVGATIWPMHTGPLFHVCMGQGWESKFSGISPKGC